MGLFKNMKDMQAQAQDAMANQGGMGGGMGGMAGMGDMGAQAAYAQLAQKLHASGVEAPGVVHSIRPTGQTDVGGGQQVEFDVSIRPAEGDPYQTTISQSMLPGAARGDRRGRGHHRQVRPGLAHVGADLRLVRR